MRNPRFYECGEGVEAHGNVRELVEQIEDEIASPNVRELVRQGREQIVLAELVGKKTFRQQKHGRPKPIVAGTGTAAEHHMGTARRAKACRQRPATAASRAGT